MALLKRAAFLCHHQHRNLLGWNSTGGRQVTVQAIRSVLSITSCELPLESSGPVRYVKKANSQTGADGLRRPPFESRDAEDEGPSSENETGGKAKSWKKGEERRPSRGRIRKGSLDPNAVEPSPDPSKRASSTRSNFNRGAEGELDGRQRTSLSETNSGEYFDDHAAFKTSVGMASQGEPTRRGTSEDVRLAARKYTVGLLSRGPQTELYLRQKMAKKTFPSQVIDEEISELQRCGLQSDNEYAEIFARSRWTDNTWGPTRIKYELLRRGISDETIQRALARTFQRSDDALDWEQEQEQDGEDEAPEGRWGMTPESARHLVAQARRRWSQGNLEIGVRRRRLIGWLQRRGFPWPTVQDVLKAVESPETF